MRIAVDPPAVDDPVCRPQHAEEGAAAAAVIGRALDQARDLDELDEDAADPGQGRHGTKRGERIVAGLDLDLGECLQERRFADVRRSDERDLGRAFASDRDRVAVNGVRADTGVLDLCQERLAQVRVWTVAVVRELGEEGADLADPVAPLFPDEPAFRHLGKRAMRHGHLDHSRSLRATVSWAIRGVATCGARLAPVLGPMVSRSSTSGLGETVRSLRSSAAPCG